LVSSDGHGIGRHLGALASYTLDGVPTVAQNGARFAVMFLAGALLHQFRDLIPARWSLVAVSVAFV